MTGPRTSREALIAEVLGEVDQLLTRVEALPATVAGAEERIAGIVSALTDAGDKYRLAVTVFTEEAKAELTEYLERKASTVTSKAVEEQRATIQEAAQQAFQSEAFAKATILASAIGTAAKEFRRSMWSRLVEHAITALIASTFTAALVYAIVKTY